jgi:hypothetical protein
MTTSPIKACTNKRCEGGRIYEDPGDHSKGFITCPDCKGLQFTCSGCDVTSECGECGGKDATKATQ